jgi:serine/threonine-protein kinase SRPK3
MAQVIELMGNFPKKLALSGKYSQELFNRKGELRHIHKLRMWPLQDVLHEKYLMPRAEADILGNFLCKMLVLDPALRASAQQMTEHPWLFVKDEVIDQDSACGFSGETRDSKDDRQHSKREDSDGRGPMDADEEEEEEKEEAQAEEDMDEDKN